MSENKISLISSEDKTMSDMNFKNTKNNIDLFHKMIEICKKNKIIPLQYVEDMVKMHKQCSFKQQNSFHLRKLILEAIKNIPGNKKALQYVANLYNTFLQLTKNDLTNVQVENCVASTSNMSASEPLELDGKTDSHEISETTKVFNELIEKCYANTNFSKSSIEIVDKLYRSLPSEFLDTKYFLKLLNESNEIIWPNSDASLSVYIQHIHDQLCQFQTSMKVQDKNKLAENDEAKKKKQQRLKKLRKSLKIVFKKIKSLEEEEMDINSEDDYDTSSPYILKDKYEARSVEIYKKICKITDEPDFLEEKKLCFNELNNEVLNKIIENYYNKTKLFPNYYEIYVLLKLTQKKRNWNWTESELENISKDAFLKLGNKLKLRRLHRYFSTISHMYSKPDPAENDLELKKKLDESSKKLNAELNEVTEKYINLQDYAEETEGSSLNNTDCEISSDDNFSDDEKFLNKKFNNTNIIPIKRKKKKSNKLEENEPPEKSQKTIYMESFNLTPCSVTIEPLNKLVNNETNVNINKVLSNETSDQLENIEKKCSKIRSENINHIPNIKTKKNAVEALNVVSEDGKKNNENLGSCNLDVEESFVCNDEDGLLVIDESLQVNNNTDEIILEKSQKNQSKKVGSNEQTMDVSIISVDSEDINPVTEPEVILHVDEVTKKDVIEINELDDSDVEITSCETPKVPVQNKKTLESIIKSMNFHKQYTWDQAQRPNQKPIQMAFIQLQKPNSVPSHGLRQNSFNQNQDTMVNRWIMHTQQPPRLNNNRFIRPPFSNVLSSASHRMQSTFHRSTTERQVTERFSNLVQQQRNIINNQSIIQQQVTTTTTTTTVRKIVQKPGESSKRRQLKAPTNQNSSIVSLRSKTNGNPELIELD